MKTVIGQRVARSAVVATACDLCRGTVRATTRLGGDDTAAGQATVAVVTGRWYEDFDDTITVEADVCGRCFRSVVRPALEALGVRFYGYRTEDGRDGVGRVAVTETKEGW